MASERADGQGRRIGWDIGGAHLKAALAVDGRIVAVVQEACPLWQGLEHLDRAFDAVLARLGAVDSHAATMTGELVDLFESRAEGVGVIAARAAARLGDAVAIYGGRAGWLAAAAAAAHVDAVASANWHATARLVAGDLPDALLVDCGSTTTDVVAIAGGAVAARGQGDGDRLACGELVYTGVVRTPLMALGADVAFAGRRVATMAEYFATAADVWRILGRLPEGADQHPAADGRGKSVADSRLRLARMIGADVAEASAVAWRGLAAVYGERQIRLVHDAAALVISGAGLADDAPLVGCGVGRFVAAEVARRLGRPCVDLATLLPLAPGVEATAVADWASHCAPAVAVAVLPAG